VAHFLCDQIMEKWLKSRLSKTASDFPNLEDTDFYKSFYSKMLDKKKVNGIHGTLHLEDIAKESFPNRRETDSGNF
jgi:hypothetical protein